MRVRSFACLLAWLCACDFGASALAAEENAAALFAALPTFGAATLSASGKYLAFAAPIQGSYNVVISEVDSPGKTSRISFGQSRVAALYWHNDSHLIVRLDTVAQDCGTNLVTGSPQRFCSGYETLYHQTYIVPVSKPDQPIAVNGNGHLGPSGFTDEIVELSSDRTHALISALDFYLAPLGRGVGNYQINLLSLNLESGASTILRTGVEQTGAWIGNGVGGIAARIDMLGPNHREILIPSGSRDVRGITTLVGPDAPLVVGIAEDGHSLAALSRSPHGTRGLYPLSLESGAIGTPLYDSSDYDALRIIKDDHNLRVVGVDYYDGNFRSYYFSPERQRLQKQIEQILPGRDAHLLSTAAEGKKTLVLTTGLQSPPALHLVNLASNRIDNLGESYPQLRATQLADSRRYTYKAGNNLSLSGVITVPRGKEARDLPLVVLPQGGFGYGLADFDWFGQFLAYRGYAVFQPGMRSTKGFEEVTDIEELKAWTNDVQEDIASGVDDLIAKGIVDRKRVCIAGGDTNGYVALLAMAFGDNRYACAMALTPLTNLNSLIFNARYSSFLAVNKVSSTFVRNHAKFSGALLNELSPALQAAPILGPVLLVDVDKVGWNTQSLNMAEGLRSEKKPVDLILMKDEDGTLSRVESRIAWLDAVDKFLSAHLAN